jgi:hypothetical protein
MPDNEILEHSVKAIEYRFAKAIKGSKDNFGNFKISKYTRSPAEIINHMYDLAIKTKTKIKEGHFNCPTPDRLNFNEEVTRFFIILGELQTMIKNNKIDIETTKRLLQGSILDIATHIGQIAMLNGLNGNRIPKESYYDADLE